MSQIKRKFIEDNAVNGVKFRLDNNQTLRGRNNANTADIDILKINASDAIEFQNTVSMGNHYIQNLLDPVNPQDAATRSFVEAQVAGISDPKDPVRLATAAALPSCTYSNGTAGVGATLTATANGALTIDGVAVATNDRILVKDQVAGLQNGIYSVTDTGGPSAAFVLTRTTDADNSPSGEVSFGMFTAVTSGSSNAQQSYFLSTANPITIGTTAMTFVKFGEVVQVGNGLSKTGSTVSVNAGNGVTFSSGALIAKLDQAATTTTLTMKFNGSGEIVGMRDYKETFTLTGTDITNQYVDLAKVAHTGSIDVVPVGGPVQRETSDYTLNYTGGTGSKTRVTFAGDMATGGGAALVSGDVLTIKYRSIDY